MAKLARIVSLLPARQYIPDEEDARHFSPGQDRLAGGDVYDGDGQSIGLPSGWRRLRFPAAHTVTHTLSQPFFFFALPLCSPGFSRGEGGPVTCDMESDEVIRSY